MLVTPITFRHPAVIAKNAALIDQMSGGRFDLGVGTGWMDFEHQAFGIPFPDSLSAGNDSKKRLAYLAAAFGPGRARHEARTTTSMLEVKPKPIGLRVIIGGSGTRRTPTLAGTKADEYNFFVCPPDEARTKIATCGKPPVIVRSRPR